MDMQYLLLYKREVAQALQEMRLTPRMAYLFGFLTPSVCVFVRSLCGVLSCCAPHFQLMGSDSCAIEVFQRDFFKKTESGSCLWLEHLKFLLVGNFYLFSSLENLPSLVMYPRLWWRLEYKSLDHSKTLNHLNVQQVIKAWTFFRKLILQACKLRLTVDFISLLITCILHTYIFLLVSYTLSFQDGGGLEK